MDHREPSSSRSEPDYLAVAYRCWPVELGKQGQPVTRPRPRTSSGVEPTWRDRVLFFDCETTVDAVLKLTFGVARVCSWTTKTTLRCLEEILIYNDDLADTDPVGFRTLIDYVATHDAETSGATGVHHLQLMSRREFVNKVLWPACKADALICGFNLPFDLSRIAVGVTPHKFNRHAFSFVLWDYPDDRGNFINAKGESHANPYRPRLVIDAINNKAAVYYFTGYKREKQQSQYGGMYEPKIVRPAFLDLRTLAYALTAKGHSLKSAGQAFGLAEDESKKHIEQHGEITFDYIDYARRDVKSYHYLLSALRGEYDKHEIDRPPERAYSPATIAKTYLRQMGIAPRLDLQPDFPPERLGQAMEAYYGGRAECHIRRTVVPIVHCDVFSMYPLINALLSLHEWHAAKRLDVVDCTTEAQSLIDSISLDDLLKPDVWSQLRFFAKIVPDGDILPVRAKYRGDADMWNIGINAYTDVAPRWYAGPDLVGDVLLSGKRPTIIEAWTLKPSGKLDLRPVNVLGRVPIDPNDTDFFSSLITERAKLKQIDPKHRDVQAFKIIANAGSYGVFVEMRPKEQTGKVRVYAGDDAYETIGKIEEPGPYCFPPIASLITAGARLMLAIIERLVTERGGTYAFCDTDSMAIVATRDGGLVPCQTANGGTINALSWDAVNTIVATIDRLNPYDRRVVRDHILKIEDVNFDSEKHQQQIYAYSIAAKRYCEFLLTDDGFQLVENKRHGLGYLHNPLDLEPHDEDEIEDERKQWEDSLWRDIVGDALGIDQTAIANGSARGLDRAWRWLDDACERTGRSRHPYKRPSRQQRRRRHSRRLRRGP